MQEEKEEFSILAYSGHWTVQAGTVGIAILLLIVIILYLHFDEIITKFFEDAIKYYKDTMKKVKARIRRKYLKMTGQLSTTVFNPQMIAKIKALGTISLAVSSSTESKKDGTKTVKTVQNGKKSPMYPDDDGMIISVIAKADGGQICQSPNIPGYFNGHATQMKR